MCGDSGVRVFGLLLNGSIKGSCSCYLPSGQFGSVCSMVVGGCTLRQESR